jgi:hypothetical protein
MSQQHKFAVVGSDREGPHDMSYRALQRRITIRARARESQESDFRVRVLDLTDKSQRVAQTMHPGKTIDDIPH